MQAGQPPLGPGSAPRERAIAFLDAMLTFKLDNRHLIRARERTTTGVRQSGNYLWAHGLLESLIREAAPEATESDPGYAAHVLLAAIDIDLVEALLATGRSPEHLRQAQAALARAVIGSPPQRSR